MNLTIDVIGIEGVTGALREFSTRRLQSALAEGLNNTARAIADEWGGQLALRIDRPTQLTRLAARVNKADVGRLVAEVSLNDQSRNAGAAPAQYLMPQEFGGDRVAKKFERALQSRGAMPAGHKVVPGKYARLDGFGNISRGQIVAVLNQLGADLSPGYRRVVSASAAKRANTAARSGRVYVAIPKSRAGVAAGIYQRSGDNLLPVFFFISRARYGKRLALQDHGKVIAQRELAPHIQRAIERRMATLLARRWGGST